MVSNIVEQLTVPERILIAADQLEKRGESPFSAEALIVASWVAYPRTFGLRGYADQYPDSNKVLSSIMGEKGLARRGWLVKMGQKLYALTREGRGVVRRLLREEADEEPETPAAVNVRLGRDLEKFVVTLLDSTAVEKFEANKKSDLTFADACRFWGIAEHMRGDVLDAKFKQLRDHLAEVDKQLAQNDAELSSGRVVSAGDLRVLANIHRYMEDRFGRHLNLLRSRSKK